MPPTQRTPLPPAWADRLLRIFCPPQLLEELLGDLHEQFDQQVVELGETTARRLYVWEVIRFCRPYFISRRLRTQTTSISTYPLHPLLGPSMLRNYLKIALRNFARHKIFSFINLGGLTLAILACLLIGLFIRHEYSYDRFHTHADRIYRVWTQELYDGQPIINPVTPYILGPTLQTTYPQIERMARVETANVNVKKGAEVLNERVHLADPDLFTIFDFPLISGSKAPLQGLYSAVISQEIAQKYFGSRNPLGQTLLMQLDSLPQAFTIRAVAKTPPTNSSIRFGILIPIAHVKAFRSERSLKSWFSVVPETFVMLRQGTDPVSLKAQFPDLLRRQLGDKFTGNNYVINLQPLIDIHLNMILAGGSEQVSDPTYSYILGAVAFFILLIACINFMTLSLGRSVSRAQEVGLRKAIGALRSQIISQFWSEALLMIGAAILLGLGLAKLLTPLFSLLVNQPLDFSFDRTMTFFLAGMLIIVGLVAGSYPALVLSRFQPVEVLKGKLSLRGDANWFRRSLVVIQFGLAVLLMVGTLVLNHQLHYLQTKSLGFQREQIVVLPINKTGAEGRQLVERLRNALTAQKQVLGVTASAFPLGEGNGWGQMGFTDEQKVYREFHFNFIDPYFLPTYGIRLVQGRNFDPANSADKFGAYIVNQAFVKKFGLKDPIHETIRGLKTEHHIIGVVDNFHYAALHSEIEPLVMLVRYDSLRKAIENITVGSPMAPDVSVKLVAGNLPASLAMLEQVWKATLPNEPFSYSFLNEDLQRQYAADQRLGQLVSIASGFSLLIACLGLFGLATLAVSRRTKEIGVRKVLGASVFSVVGLLTKDFLQLVVMGIFLACPFSWWAAHQWLANFAYRVSMPWWAFGISGLGAILIAVLTISMQSIKAARMNPVESLRTE